MTAAELRSKTKIELNEILNELLTQQFQLRMKKGTDENNPKTHLFGEIRKNIARVKTVLRESVSRSTKVPRAQATGQ